MSVLEEVIDLKNRGVSDQQIINKLEEEGISPKEINDALSRAKIKSAISDMGKIGEGMEPSIMAPEEETQSYSPGGAATDDELMPPIPSETRMKFSSLPKIQEIQQNQEYPTEVYNPMPQYSEQQYLPQENAGYGYTTDTDTMIEIAEQVFAERMKPILDKIEEVLEFKSLTETKVENISERLKRIEFQIDKLQGAILEKVGSYGRGLDLVKKGMEMMQDSFGKIAGSLAEKHHAHSAHQSSTHQTPSHTIHKIQKKTTVVHKSHRGKK